MFKALGVVFNGADVHTLLVNIHELNDKFVHKTTGVPFILYSLQQSMLDFISITLITITHNTHITAQITPLLHHEYIKWVWFTVFC